MASKVTGSRLQFNTGLISPEAEARVDIQQYGYACRQLTNMTPHVVGGVSRRGGSVYVHGTRQNDGKTQAALLVPFTVTKTISYMLELTDYHLRVYHNHELVTKEDGSAYDLPTPYSLQDLFDEDGSSRLSYLQVNDVMYFCHENHPVQKLSRYGTTDWRFEGLVLDDGPFARENTNENKVLTASGETGIVTVEAKLSGSAKRKGDLEVPAGGGNFGAVFTIEQEGKEIASGSKKTSYNEEIHKPWNSVFAQIIKSSNLGLSIETTNNYEDFILTDVSEGKIYSGKTLVFKCTLWDGRVFSYSLELDDTATELDIFSERDVGRVIRLTSQNVDTKYWYIGRESVKNGDILKSEGKYYEAQADGTCGSIKPQHTEGTESDGKITWKYLHAGYGWGTITKYISPSSVEVIVNGRFPKEISTYKWQMGILGEEGKFPHVAFYFKDRLGLGIDTKEGMNICFSKTGDYENFAEQDYGEVLNDSAFSMTILTSLCKLSFVKESEALYVGTQGQILQIRPMSSGEVFGPKNVAYDIIAPVGAKMLAPISVGGSMLFAGLKGKDLYDLGYSSDTETYEPTEVSILAKEHLAQGVIAWALQYEPKRVVWCLRRDGKLLGLTYNKSQMVQAFHLHETDGKYVSIAVIPSPDGQTDELWAVVKRGEDYRVEYFRDGLPVDVPADLSTEERAEFNRKYAFFVDSGRQYTFEAPVSRLEGLSWLGGKEVAVLADGQAYTAHVDGRTLTLELKEPASVVTVGLPYKSTLEPTPIVSTSASSAVARINQVAVRLQNSCGFWYGDGEVKDPYELESGNTLKTGDALIHWNGNQTLPDTNDKAIVNTTGARMVFETESPLPLTILGLFPQIEISGN
ncbi:MAG: hypothetical protein E7027_04445 [Elusimicrobium sp.]|uniref:Uncharacterized protein n=1 Tax=Candidatus Avelusimicrobium gallicola TaxID=2562704 RepID=A0A928DQR5_9BACT|nr:hypothetical protein [Elusimicrobium sp.]